jgi:hypothetical protein
MSKYLGSLVVVLSVVACGGATDTPFTSNGGTSAGGTSTGGDSGGSSSSAGKASGGDIATAGSVSSGGSGVGGSIVAAGSGGVSSGGVSSGGVNSGGISSGGVSGAGTVDPRCPAHRPMGMCKAADTGLNCQYDYFSQCLCYATPVGSFGPCQKVDPTCVFDNGAAGAGGSAGAGTAGSAGAGGISAKIALPPHLACSCSAMNWVCN